VIAATKGAAAAWAPQGYSDEDNDGRDNSTTNGPPGCAWQPKELLNAACAKQKRPYERRQYDDVRYETLREASHGLAT
jgi:hypothetical protein